MSQELMPLAQFFCSVDETQRKEQAKAELTRAEQQEVVTPGTTVDWLMQGRRAITGKIQ
jgi:hypothetical protein